MIEALGAIGISLGVVGAVQHVLREAMLWNQTRLVVIRLI